MGAVPGDLCAGPLGPTSNPISGLCRALDPGLVLRRDPCDCVSRCSHKEASLAITTQGKS
eukprot:2278747-Alexandrium_andersonii.AAC.1